MKFTLSISTDSKRKDIKEKCCEVLAEFLKKEGYFSVEFDPKEIDTDQNELMVGDWVYGIFSGYPQEKITMKYSICSNSYEWKYMPIPLTPEILEKNGFKQIGEKFIWGEIDDALIEIIPSINNSYRIKVSVADLMISCNIWCSYVHQLQHAFRLCVIEKGIEL